MGRAPAGIAARLKGYTSHIRRNEFPHLRSRLSTLWSRSHAIGTVGHVSEETVRRSIDGQKPVDQTIRLLIRPTAEQAAALVETHEQFTAVFNIVCTYGWQCHEKNGVRLHHRPATRSKPRTLIWSLTCTSRPASNRR